MILFIYFFFSETAGSPYFLLYPTSSYSSVIPLGACYPDKFWNEYQEAAKENRRKRKCLRFMKLLILQWTGYCGPSGVLLSQFWMSVCRYRVANIDQVYIVSSQASTYIQLIEQLINSKPLKRNPYLTLGAFDFSLPLEGGLGWLRKNTPQTHRKWKKLSQRAKSRMFSQCINFDHSSRILPNYSIEPPTHPFWRHRTLQ